ncbi:MAG TPA: GNAT family N-acetyltransferase [Anaerolineales bacterium]|nr:GNAT family N-acetyltransferase [Anaerolineales bacterium]HNA54701.1 GNAT family N-acetyltransferase [Anaerolineales bacterium]HNB87811.1 GNAT family N-acetyltransferase [Anaerolineales bacterium]HND90712.1 GNAT family N-acetyltransferase [Anaerolineales bacterium]HNF35820.1 GNAT family N-acetyltransferase [Anaerolineales bacterium]
MKTRWIQPVTLTGAHVVLEPLSLEHLDGIKEAVLDGELWKLWFTSIPSPETAETYIRSALELRENAGWMAFVVREKATNKIIGSTRYCNVDEVNQRLEIGYTWYAESYQRSAVNTECKYLLLTHAFEKLDAIAVEFRTHWHNHKSRAAIARLGAKQDGVLRNHTKSANGVYRDTVVFSIINLEWPVVKQSLEYKMSKQY